MIQKNIDKEFIEKGKEMSENQLFDYINRCLQKQLFERTKLELIPYEIETFESLIDILKYKLERQAKEKFKNDKKQDFTLLKIQRQNEKRIFEVKSKISNLHKEKDIVFQNKLHLEAFISWLKNDFNKRNNVRFNISKLAEVIINAVKITSETSSSKNSQKYQKFLHNKDELIVNLHCNNNSYEISNSNMLDIYFNRFLDTDSLENSNLKKDETNENYLLRLKHFIRIFVYFENKVPINIETEEEMEVENVSWAILPKQEGRYEKVLQHFRKLSKKKKWIAKKYFDVRRIEKIEKKLHPSKCYIGKSGFEGDVVYKFKWTDKIILESPFYANATYVIKEGWREISKLSKWEARNLHASVVQRFNHNDTWFERLKYYLTLPLKLFNSSIADKYSAISPANLKI